MSRHDAQRTAFAKGKSNITNPQPTWRFPLGGALYYTQQLIQDANGDGKPEFYFVRGSSAVGKRLDDSQMWHSPSMDVNALLALADLDGNGSPELVLTVGTNRVGVFDAISGEIDWINSGKDIGARGTVLLGDLDADGLPEILLQDCGCCTEKGDIPGGVYSFAGNAKAPKLLWQLPYSACGGGSLTTLLDLDGNGFTDVLLGRQTGFDLLDGATGTVLASLDYGNHYQYARCVPADITGVGEQAVCVLANTTPDDTGHRVFVIGHDGAGLAVLWDKPLGIADNAIALQPGLVADLDGDGLKEVIVTAKTSPSDWATYVLDGQSGATLATIDDHKLMATAPILAIGRSLILTEEGDGTAGYSFKRSPTPTVTPLWQLPAEGPLNHRDFEMSMRASPTIGLLAIDLTGDGTPDLITSTLDGTLRVYDTSQGAPGAPPMVASTPPPPYARIWAQPAFLDGKPVLATEWSDGLFRLHAIKNGALVEVAQPGVHFDGFVNTGYWRAQAGIPVVASLGPGQPASVIVVDASLNVHALDTSKADAMTPPTVRWSMQSALSPVVVPNLAGGAPGVALIQRDPTSTKPVKQMVVAVNGDGKPLWTAPLDGTGASDLLVGKLDGDGIPDIVASWTDPKDTVATVRTRALSGANGATIWDGATYLDYLVTGPSLHDWNGDGLDDVFSQSFGIVVLSGANGASIHPPPAENAQNAMPILVDTNGDQKPEVVLQGGYSKLTVVSSDLTTVFYKSDEAQSTIQYGAIAQCPSGPRHVGSTYFYHTARLTLTDLAPPQVGNMTVTYLAGGKQFPDEASAAAAGVFQGVLTAVSVHENLTGKGHPSAVVGSNDGWLYAIDPCTGVLDFAYDFKDAVGVVVFGDTDGDGLDEMIVEVADGYVYGVKQMTNTGGTGGTGTGGSGGTGTGTGGATGGAGGEGGAGTGGHGSRRPEQYLIYGRVTCVCGGPGTGETSALAPLFAGGLAAALTFRRRRRPSRFF